MQPGDRQPEIPGYRDFREVGRGGFAVVYRAHQDVFQREVAVKVVTVLDLDDDARRRFQRECTAIGRLAWHPHIVTVFDAGTTPEGWPYLVMEYLPAGSLGDRLRNQGSVTWVEATTIGQKIAGALQAAHDEGSLHRDIKPDNVLMSRLGEPMLGDFGIATLQDGTRSRSGVVTATLAYAAPEVIAGERATVASDVYSLGATLHALITGRAPFSRESDENLFAMMRRIEAEPPVDLRPLGVPNAVAAAIEGAMAKDPAARPASATAFATMLGTASSPEAHVVPVAVVEATRQVAAPELPVPPEPVTSGRRRRSRRVVAGLAIVALVAAAGGAVLLSRGGGDDAGSGDNDLTLPDDVSVAPFVDPESGVIETIVGTGTSGDSGDGPGPTTQLDNPWGVAVGGDGNIKIVDTGRNRIRIAFRGYVTTVVGSLEDGLLNQPRAVAEGPQASLLIADTFHHQVARYSADGELNVIAGTGEIGDDATGEGAFGGDGGPAIEAQLNSPHGVALADDGSIYVADTFNNRIRRIDPNGIITTIAGTGEPGGLGDGGPAAAAQLQAPLAVAMGLNGELLIADTDNHRIRRIDPNGIITTIAGTGEVGFSGDGGPALEAQFDGPSGLAVAPDGALYVVDTYNQRIRLIGADGVITTFAGTGNQGDLGDGGPATDAELNLPHGIALGPDGDLYIVDNSSRLRRVGAPT